MAGNRAIAEVKFHDLATAISTGLEYMVTSDANTLELDFIDKGTDSTFKAVIETKTSYESDWDERMAVDTRTYDMSTTPNNFNTWELDVTGVSYVRIRITVITGSVTVIGRLVG